MPIITNLPFPTLFFPHWDIEGSEMGVLIVKASFQIQERKAAQCYLPAQSELLLTDIFYEEPNTSPLKQESDLAPFKPRTDVTFNAIARSPEAKALDGWPVHLHIKQKFSYRFRVFGERFWEAAGSHHGLHWRLSSIKPISELPLSYIHTYGGTVKTAEDETITHPYNPLGCGLLNNHLLSLGDAIRVPQIGLEGEFANLRAGEPLTVCACGPLTKSWLPRLVLAGTFDETWRKERHPYMPRDYDYAYWNAAPLPLQVDPYLLGNETIELEGVRHEPQPYTFDLPGISIECQITREGSPQKETLALKLDSLHCDVSNLEQAHHWMSLTWRLTIPKPDNIKQIELFAHHLQELE